MKKQNIFKLMLSGLLISVGLASCGKCQTCTYGIYTEEFCESDFESKEVYKAYINLLEAGGANCK